MDPELFQRMQDAAARFNSGESDFEEIMTPAGAAHLVRDATDPRGFRLDFVGDGAKHMVPVQEYPPMARRPAGYPAPLPFVPDCKAIVNTLDQSVAFIDPPDPEAAVERVVRDMLDEGWEPVPVAAGDEEGSRRFAKEEAERTLGLNADFGVPRLVVREYRPSAKADD